MPVITLVDLTARALQRAAMENHPGVTAAEMCSYVNTACSETHRMLVRQHGQERFCTALTYIVTNSKAYSGTPSVVVDTSNWLGLISVHLTYPNGRSMPITSFTNVDRDRMPYAAYPWSRDAVRYGLVGTAVEFEPANVANGYTGTIRYVPGFTPMALGGGGDWDGLIQGWDDRVVLRAAMLARTKLRLDVSDLAAELAILSNDLDVTGLNFNRGAATKTPRRSRW